MNRSTTKFIVVSLFIFLFSSLSLPLTANAQQSGQFYENNVFGGRKTYDIYLTRGDILSVSIVGSYYDGGFKYSPSGIIYDPTGRVLGQFNANSPSSVVVTSTGDHIIEINWRSRGIVKHTEDEECIYVQDETLVCIDGETWDEYVDVPTSYVITYLITTVSADNPWLNYFSDDLDPNDLVQADRELPLALSKTFTAYNIVGGIVSVNYPENWYATVSNSSIAVGIGVGGNANEESIFISASEHDADQSGGFVDGDTQITISSFEEGDIEMLSDKHLEISNQLASLFIEQQLAHYRAESNYSVSEIEIDGLMGGIIYGVTNDKDVIASLYLNHDENLIEVSGHSKNHLSPAELANLTAQVADTIVYSTAQDQADPTVDISLSNNSNFINLELTQPAELSFEFGSLKFNYPEAWVVNLSDEDYLHIANTETALATSVPASGDVSIVERIIDVPTFQTFIANSESVASASDMMDRILADLEDNTSNISYVEDNFSGYPAVIISSHSPRNVVSVSIVLNIGDVLVILDGKFGGQEQSDDPITFMRTIAGTIVVSA